MSLWLFGTLYLLKVQRCQLIRYELLCVFICLVLLPSVPLELIF